MPLYYIALNDALTVVDTYIGIPVNNYNLVVIYVILLGIFIILSAFSYLKNTRNVRYSKGTIKENNG